MRKLPLIAAAATVLIAGAAVAGKSRTHVMDVPLADGSVVHVEYVGDVAPKVSLAAPRPAAFGDAWTMPGMPSFAAFDRMMAEMNRETEAMMRQAQQMSHQPAGNGIATPFIASFGKAPAGVTSTTMVSYSNGSSTCTRTTEAVSQGQGKPPKVTTSVSGNCAAAASPAPSAGPINRT